MHLEPVLLVASLRAILGRLLLTFRASVERDELLVKLSAFSVVVCWVLDAVLLVFPNLLQGAFVVLALADMDHFVVGWRWDLWLDVVGCCVHHHGRVVETALGEEANPIVAHRTRRTMKLIFAASSLHLYY